MSAHKNIDKICSVIVAVTIIIGIIFCNGDIFGIQAKANALGYENRIFDNSKVHRIDIVMDDWDEFIANCESEEYSVCNLVIDGESFSNAAIRAKGNTSLSSVKSMGSSRYSFKIEFDHYNNSATYHGLDKLCLNNIIQDNTYMKDYISYTLMNNFGVDSPLCSYADIYVNGSEWGLYLAVESIEDSFLKRNYGSQYGNLYKPDSMSFGGGRGNGMDFDMKEFMNDNSDTENGFEKPDMNFEEGSMPENKNVPDFQKGEMPEGVAPSEMFGKNGDRAGFGGMGSDDVKLKYSDDDFDSYSNIFNNAKTDITTSDKKRLVSSLKSLYEQSDIESTVDVDEVIKYFVVHNFLVNGDSYTGMMIHNYYLYEKDGQLSMIPWDYNLAFGTFQGTDASSAVNSPIDTPVSSGDMSERPMISWIFDNEEYTDRYHQLFEEFINSIDLPSLISDTAEMIDEYVKNDTSKFCTYEEFQSGVNAISEFCKLRTESVKGQLNATIPSTTDGQNADSSKLTDTSGLNISDMGTMDKGGKAGFGDFGGDMGKGDFGGRGQRNKSTENTTDAAITDTADIKLMANNDMPQGDFGGMAPPNNFNGEMPDNFNPDNIDEEFTSDEIPSAENRDFNRPEMNNFPQMNENQQSDSNKAIILFIVSVAFLIIGIIFAMKFRR